MKVLMIGSGLIEIPPVGYGAVEKHIWHLYNALKSKINVSILNKVFLKNTIGGYIFGIYALWKTLKFNGILHIHTTAVGLIFAIFGKDFIYTTHSRHWISAHGVKEKIGLMLEKFIAKKCQILIVPTSTIAHMISKAQMVIIPNGVDIDFYKPQYTGRVGDHIVCLGAVTAHKRFHIVAMALKELKLKITVIGPIKDPEYARLLKSYSMELTGELSEQSIKNLLSTADIFVHPSESEALSMAILEAMACGLPIVGSAVNEQIVNNVNGYTVPAEIEEGEKIKLYRQYITKLLTDEKLRKLFSYNSRKLAETQYSWNVVSTKVLKVYLSHNMQK